MRRGAPHGYLEGLLVAQTKSPDSDKERRGRQDALEYHRVTQGDVG
jgi:hypothetical protein